MRPVWLGLVLTALLIPIGARGQDGAVGTVATASGETEITRAGATVAAAVGSDVEIGDELSTGAGQMRVVFRDDSILDLSEYSSVVVDDQVFEPDAGHFTSLVKWLTGKARALVSSYYESPGSSYEIETPNAVAGVRGTSFLISYDPASDKTEVIGIERRVEVRNLSERLSDTVYVTAQESTTVLRDEVPTQPEPVADEFYRRETDVLQPLAGVTASTAAQVDGGEQNAGDTAGQPFGVLNSRGSLGVPVPGK